VLRLLALTCFVLFCCFFCVSIVCHCCAVLSLVAGYWLFVCLLACLFGFMFVEGLFFVDCLFVCVFVCLSFWLFV